MRIRHAADRLAVAALCSLYLLWGGWLAHGGRYCNSDCIVEMLPRLQGAARPFQSGVLAWWDVNTFAGGKPFWETFGGLYYPVFYPLYLLTDLDDPQQAALLLHLLPYVLHHLWAALGAYCFARRVLNLTIAGALVVAAVFTFSPPMLEIALVNQVRGYSYLPWILLAGVRLLDGGTPRTWAAGALAVGGMAFASNPDHVNRTLFIAALHLAAYALLTATGGIGLRSVMRRLLAILAMIVVGLGTYAFGFIGIFRGITSQLKGVTMACEQVASYATYSSAPPLSYLTLLFPGFFVETVAGKAFVREDRLDIAVE